MKAIERAGWTSLKPAAKRIAKNTIRSGVRVTYGPNLDDGEFHYANEYHVNGSVVYGSYAALRYASRIAES